MGLKVNRNVKIYLTLLFSPLLSAYAGVAAVNNPPSSGGISPVSGYSRPNQSIVFSATYRDPNGWRNIQDADLLIGNLDIARNILQPAYFCAYYNQNENRLYVMNNATNKWIGGFNPGSARTIETQYGILNCRNTSILGAGNTLKVNWNITFKSAISGRRNTYLYAKDDSGLIANWKRAGSWTIDGAPPSGTIIINNNAAAVNSVQVTLTLSANDALTNVSQMKFSNDNINWTVAEVFAVNKNWALLHGDGQKTVYVKYKDGAGNWSNAFSDSIILDTIPPAIKITNMENGDIIIGYGY